MSTERNFTFGDIEISCDVVGCQATDSYDVDGDFPQMAREAKSDGWHFSKENGQWSHICYDCWEKGER